jgi:hypothetical protein
MNESPLGQMALQAQLGAGAPGARILLCRPRNYLSATFNVLARQLDLGSTDSLPDGLRGCEARLRFVAVALPESVDHPRSTLPY